MVLEICIQSYLGKKSKLDFLHKICFSIFKVGLGMFMGEARCMGGWFCGGLDLGSLPLELKLSVKITKVKSILYLRD